MLGHKLTAHGPVTLDRTEKRTSPENTSVDVRHCSFNVLLLSAKYASYSVMLVTSVSNSFCRAYILNASLFLRIRSCGFSVALSGDTSFSVPPSIIGLCRLTFLWLSLFTC